MPDCESSTARTTLPEQQEGGEVRQDWDYMRRMLVEMEESDDWQFHLMSAQGRPRQTDAKHDYHVMLLRDAGLLAEMAPGIFRMTSRGHDFISHTNDPTIWDRSKGVMTGVKSYSVKMMMDIAEGYVRAKLREVTGLDL